MPGYVKDRELHSSHWSVKIQSAGAALDVAATGDANAVLTSSIEANPQGMAEGMKMHVDRPTGTKDLATGPHKEKEVVQAVAAVAGKPQDSFANVTALREVCCKRVQNAPQCLHLTWHKHQRCPCGAVWLLMSEACRASFLSTRTACKLSRECRSSICMNLAGCGAFLWCFPSVWQ